MQRFWEIFYSIFKYISVLLIIAAFLIVVLLDSPLFVGKRIFLILLFMALGIITFIFLPSIKQTELRAIIQLLLTIIAFLIFAWTFLAYALIIND